MAQSSSPETSARVVVLENENITNKIKLVQQNFNSQLNLLKLEFKKKLSDVEYKQKHNPQNFQSRNRTSQDFKDFISKHDVLNTRMRKVEQALEEDIKKKTNVKGRQLNRRSQTLDEENDERDLYRIHSSSNPKYKSVE